MASIINRQYYLARRPNGVPVAEDVPVREVEVPELGPDEVLLRNLYISLDPAIRGWMGDDPNYIEPIALGEVVRSSVLGEVVASTSDAFAIGDIAMTMGGWESHTQVPAAMANPVQVPPGVDLSWFLGVLGPTGLTAYFGLLDVGKPRAGETVLVSAAAGAVGSIVGQIAKLQGCRVVGMAGSDAKCAWLTEALGFDAAINYKTCGDFTEAIAAACPQGIDVYFDNVGGEIFDAALLCLNKFARVAVCGWISTYNDVEQQGRHNLWQLVAKSVTIQGFVVLDYTERFPEGIEQLAQWLLAGQLQFKEEVVEGLDNTFATFLKLFDGSNQGKLVMKVGEP